MSSARPHSEPLNAEVRLKDGRVIGCIARAGTGFIFVPHMDSHRSSRKVHPTQAAAVPRWVKKMIALDVSQ